MLWAFGALDVLLVWTFGMTIREAGKRDDRRNERERQYYEQYRRNSD